jgi:hypothetical protein
MERDKWFGSGLASRELMLLASLRCTKLSAVAEWIEGMAEESAGKK